MITNLVFSVLDSVWSFINECSEDPVKRSTYTSCKNFFTRNRKLTFKDLVGIILSNRKSNIMTNLQNYFGWYISPDATKTVTKSAFSQQRDKILYGFFIQLLVVLRTAFYKEGNLLVKKWKKWILTALDGSRISLPDTKKIRDKFGTQRHAKSEERSPIGRASFAYDPLNKIILTGHLVNKAISELTLAIEDILNLPSGHLFLMDRGYCSFLIIYILISRGEKFVCRCKTRQLIEVKNFLATDKTEECIEMKAYQKAVKQLKDLSYNVKNGQTLNVRAVKIPLSSGETEVLLTNLTPEEASRDELAELYNLRWGEEVAIGIMKNEEQLEIFTSVRVNGVKQDFFATLFLYDFEMMLEKIEEEKLQVINQEYEKKGKLPLAINHNECWNTTKKLIKHWLMVQDCQASHHAFLQILPMFADNRYSVRKDRKFPRTFRIVKLLGKYITLNNYRAVG